MDAIPNNGRGMFRGDLTGVSFPTDIPTLVAAGPEFLTNAFHATGALARDNRVTAITHAAEFAGGGQGQKMTLDVAYARPDPGLHERLFVKFQLLPDHPLRALFVHQMEPEVRFALLSRRRGFPIRVPVCYFADREAKSESALLITERVPFGAEGIEPMYDKCLDYLIDNPFDHYRAITHALAKLAGFHRSGRLGDTVDQAFPFALTALNATRLISFSRDELIARFTQIRAFMTEMPQLFPAELRDQTFWDQFCRDAATVFDKESDIHRYINGQSDLIALCHFNMNIDNAWFWRDANGERQCGLLDWGLVSQMNVAHSFFGMACGAEQDFLAVHEEGLMVQFLDEYQAQGGPRGSLESFTRCVHLAAALKGVAWMLGGLLSIRAELTAMDNLKDRYDPRIADHFLRRINLQYWITFLSGWRRNDIGRIVRSVCGRFRP
jgi:hypothetical protein